MTSTTNNTDRNITFVSLNVKGINNALKRQKIDSYLKQLKVVVAYLQETHLKQNQLKHLGWSAILIHKDIPFQSEVISDSAGC